MKHEDDLAQRDAEAYHKLIHGDRAGTPTGEADEMGDNIFLGDYAVTQHLPQSPQSPQPQQSTGVLSKALIGAGLIATGAGAAYGVPLLISAVTPDPPAISQPADPVEPKVIKDDWEVGEPFFGKPDL